MRKRLIPVFIVFTVAVPAGAASGPNETAARAALKKAARFFVEEVAVEGGYLWRYSADLARREGEGTAGPTTVWVQPPGTPTVGGALLRAHELTGEEICMAGAVAAARALVRGQLRSGGWTYRIEFAPKSRRRYAYRVDRPPGRKARDVTTLDDNTTQSALSFLMRMDRALAFKDTEIHEAARYALAAILKYQFGSGGWPQGIRDTVDPKSCPRRKASYPDSWPRTYPGHRNYRYRPTINDNLMADMISTLFEAAEIYRDDACRAAALRGGEFLLLAQLPEPQPGWAQQYDYDMQPMWARKFEPPAITGGEARGVLETLMALYRRTGDKKWIEPIPRALAYYKRSRLPGGKLARFYELKTNRPLFFTKDYTLTYDDADVPTHYAFTVGDWTGSIEKKLANLKPSPPAESPRRVSAGRARALVAALDGRGAWVEEGRLKYYSETDPTRRIISCRTFAKNLVALAAYVAGGEQ